MQNGVGYQCLCVKLAAPKPFTMTNKLQSRAGLFLLLLLAACTQNHSVSFSTAQDSISFARAVMEKYPLGASPRSQAKLTRDTTRIDDKGTRPIAWSDVISFKDYYDKDPVLTNPSGQPYHGWMVSPEGYARIKAIPEIEALYLRMGRKPDGSYTIMLLGMDGKGNVLNVGKDTLLGNPKDSTNYDFNEPCPNTCASNFD
ncbi:MAG: hypothetical protein JWQ27_1279 [Ferruginibacter sp.]|nr:hypothetical protein [Ferruginibacter sp.]